MNRWHRNKAISRYWREKSAKDKAMRKQYAEAAAQRRLKEWPNNL